MMRRVVITGVGLISSLGDSLDTLRAALCEGRCSLQPIRAFDPDGLRCRQAHSIGDFSPEAYLGKRNFRALDRTAQLVASAVKLALENSGWSVEMCQQHEVGLVLGTMFCSARTISEFDRRGLTLGPSHVSPMDFANTVINAAAGQAAIWHGLRGINSTIASGMASGLHAIAYATDLIRNGQATALLAGGADELCFETFYGFDRAGLLCGTDDAGAHPIPFDARRDGFALGEGASFVMLENAQYAARRGASVLAEIKGHGQGYDLSRRTDGNRSINAITKGIRQALRDAQVAADAIDGLSASANGSVVLDHHEACAIAAAFQQHTARLPVTAIKSMLGETLGASGALQTVAMLTTMRDGDWPGIRQLEHLEDGFPLPLASACNQHVELRHGLINAIDLDGNSCALVIARCEG